MDYHKYYCKYVCIFYSENTPNILKYKNLIIKYKKICGVDFFYFNIFYVLIVTLDNVINTNQKNCDNIWIHLMKIVAIKKTPEQ